MTCRIVLSSRASRPLETSNVFPVWCAARTMLSSMGISSDVELFRLAWSVYA